MDRSNTPPPDKPGDPNDHATGDPEGNRPTGDPGDNRATGNLKGNRPTTTSNRRELLRYAGLSSEVFVSVGLSIFIGIKADKWVALSFPLFSLALPLLVIVALIIKLVKETSRNKDGK